MTTAPDFVALARGYVETSNRHDLEAIAPLFADDAAYRSTAVGSYEGRAAILEMMTDFFAAFPDVTWQAGDYRLEPASRSVVFDFTLRATHAQTNEGLVRTGVESLRFSERGLIVEIDVSASA